MKKNLSKRLLVVILGIIVIVFSVYYGSLPFLFLVSFIILISLKEFYDIFKKIRIYADSWLGFLISSLLILSFFVNSFYNLVFTNMLLVLSVILPFIFAIFKKNIKDSLNTVVFTLFGIMYITWTLSHLLFIRELDSYGSKYIYLIFISIWILDSAAYFVGSKFGRHKIFPHISPKKSIEGSIAGFLFAIIGVVICKFIFVKILTVQEAVFFGIIIGVFGQLGDAAESLIKRTANVKDSSNILPGHGGFLDRFDSLIFVSPLIYYYLRFITDK